ncbi:putative complex i intermediate-associated protein 84 protein [Phaeoacremonium minimum UCRPA7]|uniref:Putative complex i intermediate-associated protein 84 protein n=1 Tax=Phaeoacremonium minimum (strain UCR-PA7) TaxID=1286976 RepID=R8BVY3_PHAM7|nr:putative complex i intermediate-associated protein 84 protein [Phaeoacremonium minimum UCRPA7]EOO03518.1 putative complex i intermediate-associated protein 84 protein [Phaeoacremonium minimum UCRPA7]
MLKMDTTIQPTTKLYNALMIAYLAADDAGRALDIWHDITHSVEGPSYNSLATVFRVCEVLPMGDQKANEIWEKMRRMDIEVPPVVYAAYCGAIAGQGQVEEVKGLIQAMEADTGSPVDMMTIGVSYNALPGQSLQASFQEWAQAEYPALWKRLEKQGKKKTMDGLLSFNLNREMKA